jgi:hypothetical protein
VTIPQPIQLSPANARIAIRQNGFERTFGDRAFQIQFSTTNLEMTSQVGANVFPILTPSPAAKGRRIFKEDVVLMGCYLSVSFVSVAAAETECVALARNSPNRLSALGDANTFLQSTLANAAAGPAGSLVQRNVGTMFARRSSRSFLERAATVRQRPDRRELVLPGDGFLCTVTGLPTLDASLTYDSRTFRALSLATGPAVVPAG